VAASLGQVFYALQLVRVDADQRPIGDAVNLGTISVPVTVDFDEDGARAGVVKIAKAGIASQMTMLD
jgi:hypothetical protein